MKPPIPLALACLLAACANNQLTPTGQLAAGAAVTLASVAAANNTTVNKIIQQGQLICQSPATGVLVAVVEGMTSPTTVAGQAAADVAKACPYVAGIKTVPTPLPVGTDPATVQAVAPAPALPVQV